MTAQERTYEDLYVPEFRAPIGDSVDEEVTLIATVPPKGGNHGIAFFRTDAGNCLVWFDAPPSVVRLRGRPRVRIAGTVSGNTVYRNIHQTVLSGVRITADEDFDRRTPGQRAEEAWRVLMTEPIVEMRYVATILDTSTTKIFAALRDAGILVRTDTGHTTAEGYGDLFRVVRVKRDGEEYDKPLALPVAMPLIARVWADR